LISPTPIAYSNSVLYGLPKSSLSSLTSVIYIAAQLKTSTPEITSPSLSTSTPLVTHPGSDFF